MIIGDITIKVVQICRIVFILHQHQIPLLTLLRLHACQKKNGKLPIMIIRIMQIVEAMIMTVIIITRFFIKKKRIEINSRIKFI